MAALPEGFIADAPEGFVADQVAAAKAKPDEELPILDPETQVPQFIHGPRGITPLGLNLSQATAPIVPLPRFQSQAPPAGSLPVLDAETQLPVRYELPGGGSKPASVDPLFAATANTPIAFAEGAESPLGLATLPFAGTRAGSALIRGIFGGLAAKQGAQQLGEASVTGDVQKGAEGVLQLAAAPAITGFGGRAEPSTERITDATGKQPESEHSGVTQGADVPPEPTQVREAAGQPDSGGGGAVSGEKEQANVQAKTPNDIAAEVGGWKFDGEHGGFKIGTVNVPKRLRFTRTVEGQETTIDIPTDAKPAEIAEKLQAKAKEFADASVGVDELIPKPAGEVDAESISGLPDAEAAKFFQSRQKAGIATQYDSVLAGMKLKESDVPDLEALRDEAQEKAMAAIPTGDNTAFLANSGKVIWLNGAIEGAKRKGPNYDLVNEVTPSKAEVPAPDAQAPKVVGGELPASISPASGEVAKVDNGAAVEPNAAPAETKAPVSGTEPTDTATNQAEGGTMPPTSAPPADIEISKGPGAASPGDVPPLPPETAPISARPPEDRPNGTVTPSSPGLSSMIHGMGAKVRTLLKGMAGDSMPKTTAADRATGEAGVRYASSPIFAQRAARLFASQTLHGTGLDPVKFGAALVEDNLRSIREGFRSEVTRLTAEQKPEQAAEAKAKADAVTSLVGVRKSPFRDEDAYQDYLIEPGTRRAIDQHKQQWEEVVDPLFKRAQGIDPDVELPTRGQQTGARVNLKAVLGDEPGISVVRTGPSLTATFKRKSPFAVAAKGTGKAYEVDYNELMNNTFARQMEIANKNAFDKSLVESGNAVIDKPGQQITIKGEPGVPFPLSRRVLVGKGDPVPLAQNIYVRQSIAREYRTAANVDPGARIPVLTPIMNGLNRAALAGLTDATVHVSNQMTALFNRPVSGGLISDTLLAATGRADVPVTLAKAVLKSFQDNEAQLTQLAEIGALRDSHTGGAMGLGGLLMKTDRITRLMLDDTFKRLTESGLVENTETARREYVNQIGQYNKRLQGPMVRLLRDTGFGPFATAGRTFNALGVKMATLGPGVQGANAFAAAGLRANVLSKWVGFATLLGTLNYLLTNDKGGGVMGRKGVPIGNLDTGTDDKRGRPLSLPLADIMGLGRAARVTGVKGAVQAKYLGLTDTDALDAAARDIINSATGPALGPGIRGATVAATGSPPAVGVPRTAPVAPPGTSQFKLNVEEALKDANPVVKSFLDYTRGGKSLREALGQQVPRFGLVAGKPEATAANFPKIVNRAQLNAYTEAVAREARQQPLKDRRQWISDRLAKDNLSPQNALAAAALIRRKGVLSFQ